MKLCELSVTETFLELSEIIKVTAETEQNRNDSSSTSRTGRRSRSKGRQKSRSRSQSKSSEKLLLSDTNDVEELLGYYHYFYQHLRLHIKHILLKTNNMFFNQKYNWGDQKGSKGSLQKNFYVENINIHFQFYIIVTGYYFGEYQKQAWVFVGEISSSISKKEIESGGYILSIL